QPPRDGERLDAVACQALVLRDLRRTSSTRLQIVPYVDERQCRLRAEQRVAAQQLLVISGDAQRARRLLPLQRLFDVPEQLQFPRLELALGVGPSGHPHFAVEAIEAPLDEIEVGEDQL